MYTSILTSRIKSIPSSYLPYFHVSNSALFFQSTLVFSVSIDIALTRSIGQTYFLWVSTLKISIVCKFNNLLLWYTWFYVIQIISTLQLSDACQTCVSELGRHRYRPSHIKHYPNQRLRVIECAIGNIFIKENAFENVICKMKTILFKYQCVNYPVQEWWLVHYLLQHQIT